MNNLLLLVLGVYIFVKFTMPMLNDINEKNTQIAILENAIKKDLQLNKEKAKILQKLNESKKIDAQNLKYVYPSKMTNTVIFAKLQNFIKHNADLADVNIRNISWLSAVDKGNYILLPIKVRIRTIPSKFKTFLQNMCKSNKILYSDVLKTMALKTYFNRFVDYELVIYTVKIKD